MPQPGMQWRHVVISTLNSWLPGDPRGFRSRRHKIHSSGDYRNPPPPGEHAGLHHYSKRISGNPVVIPQELRSAAGRAIIRKVAKLQYRVLAVFVAGMHSHMLVELPNSLGLVRKIVGECKTVSSHVLRTRLPGRVWAAGGSFKPVNDLDHQRNVFLYILEQQDAWIWSFREGMPE